LENGFVLEELFELAEPWWKYGSIKYWGMRESALVAELDELFSHLRYWAVDTPLPCHWNFLHIQRMNNFVNELERRLAVPDGLVKTLKRFGELWFEGRLPVGEEEEEEEDDEDDEIMMT
jgi:hypothetical protein